MAEKKGKIALLGSIWSWGDYSARSIRKALDEMGAVDEIEVEMNSPGGSAIDGVAIYNMLKTHSANVTVRVMGWAASAASIIAMAGDSIVMEEGTFLMVHQAYGLALGTAKEVGDFAKALETINEQMAGIYARRSGKTLAEAEKWMDGETWFGPEAAVKAGLATEAVQSKDAAKTKAAMAAHARRLMGFARNAPEEVKAALEWGMGNGECETEAVELGLAAEGVQMVLGDVEARAVREFLVGVPRNAGPGPGGPGNTDERTDAQMSEEQKTDQAQTAPAAPVAASLEEIKAACEGAPAEFVLRMLEAKATPETVKAAWSERQAALVEAKAESAKASKAAEEPKKVAAQKPLGTEPGAQAESAGDAKSQWDDLVAKHRAKGLDAAAAAKAANRENPDLREAMVAQMNTGRRKR